MDDTLWNEVDDWFGRALDRPPAERDRLLEACPRVEIRERVHRLLKAAALSGDLLASSGPCLAWPDDRSVAWERTREVFAPGRDLLGRYRVQEQLGAGGMGVVFRAGDLKLQRDVAIKVLAGAVVDRDRLLREARAAAALNHPNLVGVYDVGEADGIPFLVMELVAGPTLEEEPPRSIEEAVGVAIQVCEALTHVHRRGMVHRDLKPGNLLRVRQDGPAKVKLIDLGLARADGDAALTRDRHILGTPAYMAPELGRGEALDARTDLYALGVMLYRWTTGRLPFTAEDPMVQIAQHIHAPVASPTDRNPEIPADLEYVITTLLAKQPDRRFPDATAVAERLRALRPQGEPPRGPTPTAVPPSLETGRRSLRRGEWDQAFASLRVAADSGEVEPRDLTGLATAALRSGHFDAILPALERAVAAYTRGGDSAGAASVSAQLANYHLERRELGPAERWLRRADRLLQSLPEGSTHALACWLRCRLRLSRNDTEGCRREGERAIEIARRVGDRDCEALCLLSLGHLAVVERRFDVGLPMLDEAGSMAMSGELGATAAGTVLCGMIFAWRALGDWGRAAEWTQAQSRWCEREKVALYPGLCRVHRGELIRLRGDLQEAERALREGAEELVPIDRWVASVAYRELGEVRRRRGDLAGAEEAFRRAVELGSDAQPGLARLRLMEGNPEEALRGLRRALEGDPVNPLDVENRAYVLPTLVTVALAAGDREAAARAVEELEQHGASTGASAFRAAALAGRGELLLADGDAAAAVASMLQASRTWSEIDAPYEVAQVKVNLAEALRQDGNPHEARLHLQAALRIFERLGATLDAGQARRRLAEAVEITPPADADRRPQAWAFAEVVGADQLITVLGGEAWCAFDGWLHRTLGRCCATHGGSPAGKAPGGFGASFRDVDGALACALEMQGALRDHRARHGFAPSIRIGIVPAGKNGIDRARSLAGRGLPGDVLTVGELAAQSDWWRSPLPGDPHIVRLTPEPPDTGADGRGTPT
jgi:tetratricopeptide (TPR) repeat protein